MSLGAVVNNSSRKKPSDGQFVGDLAGLFERRHIALGKPHVCEQLEILLRTSDSFRGQLFTLCTAISHMGDHDLSGDELLDLIARALGTESPDGSQLPQPLRESFLSGFHEWQNRGVSGEDEWPPRKKPSGSVAHPPSISPGELPQDPFKAEAAEPPAFTTRPAGLPTMQEALEIARIRGGDRPLRPERDEFAPSEPQPPAADLSAEPTAQPDSETATIHELSTLLHEIQERMNRLRPHVVPTERTDAPTDRPTAATEPAAPPAASAASRAPATPTVPPTAGSSALDYRKLDIFKPGADLDIFSRQTSSLAPSSPPRPVQPEHETDKPDMGLYGRYPYLMNRHPSPLVDAKDSEPAKQAFPEPQPELELRLVPRTVVLDEIELAKKPARSAAAAADSAKLKTYIIIAILAGIVLVGAPISVVVAYRYMHPLYIYDTKPEVTPAAPPDSTADPNSGQPKPAAPTRSKPHRKAPPPAHKPATQVWPFPEQ